MYCVLWRWLVVVCGSLLGWVWFVDGWLICLCVLCWILIVWLDVVIVIVLEWMCVSLVWIVYWWCICLVMCWLFVIVDCWLVMLLLCDIGSLSWLWVDRYRCCVCYYCCYESWYRECLLFVFCGWCSVSVFVLDDGYVFFYGFSELVLFGCIK